MSNLLFLLEWTIVDLHNLCKRDVVWIAKLYPLDTHLAVRHLKPVPFSVAKERNCSSIKTLYVHNILSTKTRQKEKSNWELTSELNMSASLPNSSSQFERIGKKVNHDSWIMICVRLVPQFKIHMAHTHNDWETVTRFIDAQHIFYINFYQKSMPTKSFTCYRLLVCSVH